MSLAGEVHVNDQKGGVSFFPHPTVWDALAPIGVLSFWNQKLINKLH